MKPDKHQERLEVLDRIAEYEKSGKFNDDVEIFIVTSVFNGTKIKRYKVEDILSFSKSINSMMLRKE